MHTVKSISPGIQTSTTLFTLSVATLLYVPLQGEWLVICCAWATAFYAFLGFCTKRDRIRLKEILFIALFVRILAVCNVPNLSDDFVRFLWDGSLLADGMNPYLFKPSESSLVHGDIPFDVLLDQLNSPDYFSVYPPLMQLVFLLAGSIDSVYASVITLKSVLFAGECLTFLVLLRGLDAGERKNMMWYALNPMVVVEGMGNLHFEILAIPFIALTAYSMKKSKWTLGGCSLGTAVGIKLNPLLFLPLSLRYLRQKREYGLLYWAVFIAAIALSPLLIGNSWMGFFDSIRLYFQTFEFNAGPYFVLRDAVSSRAGYNPIATLGPALGLFGLVCNFLIGWYPGSSKWSHCMRRWQWGFLVYLLCSTIIHPWYILPLVFLSTMTGLIFPLVWSASIVLSYAFYGLENDIWHLILIALEYTVLFLAVFWDIKKRPGTSLLPDAF